MQTTKQQEQAGGATDIRLVSGNWNDAKGLASRIIVAGRRWSESLGATLLDMEDGVNGTTGCVAQPGTQTSGYAFGVGQNGWGVADSDGVGRTVAGGYWGGCAYNYSGSSAGAGGSGYVSGHTECIGIKAEDDTTPKVTKYSEISDSYHYSGKVFKNTTLTAGISDTSKAVITSLKSMDEQVITNITVDKGHITREFNPAETDYYIELR